MLESLYLKLARCLTLAVVLLSGTASLILWNGPDPVGFNASKAEAMRVGAAAVVGVLGALLPLVTVASRATSFRRTKAAVFTAAGLANSFALSPALTAPFKGALCTLAMVVAFVMVIGQIALIWASTEAKPPHSKF